MSAYINVLLDSIESGAGSGAGGNYFETYRKWILSTMRHAKNHFASGQESKRWEGHPTFAFALSVCGVRLCQSHTFTIASKA